MTRPLFEGSDWTFDLIKKVYDAIEEVAIGEMGLDIYPNQIEMISSEQMLDAYSSIGMPLMYRHWSFGKHFARDQQMYKRGQMGLAYEIVINSNPCVAYLMEENSMTMQTLVMSHASYGHNHVFKNNCLFQQWTDADAILDYLGFAKRYVEKCEERYGSEAVELTLDSCHALMDQGVDRYRRPPKLSVKEEIERQLWREEESRRNYNDLWRTLPEIKKEDEDSTTSQPKRQDHDKESPLHKMNLPEENLLYFLEKNSPVLTSWQRELVRICRKIAQYFYPQRQTKVLNEGAATYFHYKIMNRLYDKNLLTDASMIEFLHNHSSVVAQPSFDSPYYSGINPYTLGFNMMRDIERIATDPTDEDHEWFPWAGNGDALGMIKEAIADYRDESFMMQFMSPKIIRDMRLFMVLDQENPFVEVSGIHNERGYKAIRKALARTYNVAHTDPDIQVVDVDLLGSRKLHLQHTMYRKKPLAEEGTEEVMKHLVNLWGYEVVVSSVDNETGHVVSEMSIKP